MESILIIFGLVIAFIGLFFASISLGAKLLPNWIYQGPVTDHFDGRKFHFKGMTNRTLSEVLYWRFSRKPVPWPKHVPLTKIFPAPQKRHTGNDPLITFIGHSSFLVQWKGLNILIDPVYQTFVGPNSWNLLAIKRVHEPGIKFDELPPIDVVLVSHNHFDHMDISTLRKLWEKDRPLIITGLGNRKKLENNGIEKVVELDWWDEKALNEDLEIQYLPAKHSSNRSVYDFDFTLWGGFAIKAKDKYLYYSGDTAYDSHFKEIKNRLGSPFFAVLPIGAYEPRWFMDRVHMNPEEMLFAWKDLGAKYAMTVHFGMLPLADEGIDEPTDSLKGFMAEENLTAEQIWIPLPGESRKLL